MALPRFARDTITVLRAQTAISHGTSTRNWNLPPVATVVPGCSFQPGVGSEIFDRRDAVEGAAVVFLPPEVDIDGHDRVQYGPDVYEVFGSPNDWHSPSGRLDHKIVMLRRWDG